MATESDVKIAGATERARTGIANLRAGLERPSGGMERFNEPRYPAYGWVDLP